MKGVGLLAMLGLSLIGFGPLSITCLIGLHAVAGLGHHYLIKDNTLLRMLPGRS